MHGRQAQWEWPGKDGPVQMTPPTCPMLAKLASPMTNQPEVRVVGQPLHFTRTKQEREQHLGGAVSRPLAAGTTRVNGKVKPTTNIGPLHLTMVAPTSSCYAAIRRADWVTPAVPLLFQQTLTAYSFAAI
eukprot:1158735-Pelagomonas_calceolata.AAC.3